MARDMKSDASGEKRLEQYGVWVKVEPQEVLEKGPGEDSFSLSDLESPAGGRGGAAVATADEALTQEEEELLDELDTELGPEPEEAGEPASMEETGSSVEVSLSEEVAEEHFDDLRALEDELASVTSTAAPAASGTPAPGVLARIEDELRSIRGDLTSLKKELAVLRKPPAAGKQRGEEAVGFFDEDEDETIALTGDELDNILNTAEITEEPAEAAPLDSEPLEELVEEDATLDAGADLLSYEAPGDAPRAAAPIVAAAEELGLEELPEIELAEDGETGAAPLDSLDLESGGDQDPAEEMEALPEIEELAEAPAADAEELPQDIDLQALTEQAEEEPDSSPLGESSDLGVADLEVLPEDESASPEEEKEIKIDFEEPSAKAGGEAAEEVEEVEELTAEELTPASPQTTPRSGAPAAIPGELKDDIRTVLKYMDHLLEALPEEKIQEFASSEYFVMYKKLFEDLGLGE